MSGMMKANRTRRGSTRSRPLAAQLSLLGNDDLVDVPLRERVKAVAVATEPWKAIAVVAKPSEAAIAIAVAVVTEQ